MKIDFSKVVTAEMRAALALEEAKATAKAMVLREIDAATMEITGPVPLAEKLSWSAKEEAARAVLAKINTRAQATVLISEATMTGESLDELVAKVIRNADAYQAFVAQTAGLRRRTDRAIEEAATIAEVELATSTLQEALSALTK